jgi:hypothetical protein
MGFLKGLLGAAAPIVGNLIAPGIGGAVGGLLGGAIAGSGGSSQTGNLTTTTQNQMDPRIGNIVFGQNGNSGLLGKYQGLLDTPQSAAMQQYDLQSQDYLNRYGQADQSALRGAATGLLGGTAAPRMEAPAWAQGSMVNAPAQNNLNLSGAYDKMINGDPAANPYLTGAIGKGINQSNNAFQNMQTNATTNLMHNILPSIRSDSVLAGQYGGSRQGVAEGNAIGDFARAQQQAVGQFGQNNTDAAVAAQAGAFDNGQNRALAAMQGLGAQQYATAAQNTATQNAAEFNNVGQVMHVNDQNLASQLQTNAQNTGAKLGGAGILGGLGSTAYNAGQALDQYGINRAQQVNGLLTPYLSANSSQTQSQPLYQNQAGNMLGGAMFGAQLGQGLLGGSSGAGSQLDGIMKMLGIGPGTIGAGV